MNNKSSKTLNVNMIAVPAIKGKMQEKFKPLLEAMEKAENVHVNFKEAASYANAVNALEGGKAEIAWLGQGAYLEALKKVDLELLAVATSDGKQETIYTTKFITSHNSIISSISDFRGKRLVLTEKGSTSGDLIPRHILSQSGMDPDVRTSFSMVNYAGSQEEAVNRVLSNTADIAAISDVNLEELIQRVGS